MTTPSVLCLIGIIVSRPWRAGKHGKETFPKEVASEACAGHDPTGRYRAIRGQEHHGFPCGSTMLDGS